jgi:HK97 family phage major capsid protein
MPTLVELDRELQQKRGELKKLFDDHRKIVNGSEVLDLSADQVQEVRRREDELAPIADAYKQAAELAAIDEENRKALGDLGRIVRPVPFAGGSADDPGATPGSTPATKSLGERFVESAAYKTWRPGGGQQQAFFEVPEQLGFAAKTTFTTAVSTLTEYDRQPGMVMIGQQALTIADLISQGETTMNTIRYVREDTYTNAATTVAEGGTKPEAAFDTSEVDAPVRKIAVTGKVTDEMFGDFPVIRDYVNNRLQFMVAQQEEAQILLGNGTPPNIQGIETTSGIQTQAAGTDPLPDAVFKAITKIASVGFFQADGVVFNPFDWQNVKLLKTADGIYIWGHPADPGPNRLWGLPVVATVAQTQHTAFVGAFKLGAQVFRRQGITLETTNSNVDDFVKNLITIRAEERLALAVYRPLAFCTVTGLP